MKPAPLPSNEDSRLKSLQELQVMDTLPEDQYDDVTRIASEITGTPVALLTLIDKDRQWFKAKQGYETKETPRELSFCAHAIINPNEIFVVNDARFDERFHDNPLTLGETPVIFYAGVPITDSDNRALGTICVIDHRPRELADHKLEALKALAKLVKTLFELRRVSAKIEHANKELAKILPLACTIEDQVTVLLNRSAKADESTIPTALQDAIIALKDIGKL